MITGIRLLVLLGSLCVSAVGSTATYYVDAVRGDDQAGGTERGQPWRTLAQAQQARLDPGDRLLLAAGVETSGAALLFALAGLVA